MKRSSLLAYAPGLLLAACAGQSGTPLPLNPLSTSGNGLRRSDALLVHPEFTIADTRSFTTATDSGTINFDATYSNFSGSSASGLKFSGSVSGTATSTVLRYSVSKGSQTATGSLTRVTSGASVKTTRSDGTVVAYTKSASGTTGTASVGSTHYSVSTSGTLSNYSTAVAGSLTGKYATAAQDDGGGGGGCRNGKPCPLGVDPESGLSNIAVAFDGAGIFLGFLPGMQGFALGCAAIGFGLGFWDSFHDK